ncbi:hypothetical protein [Lysobacter humi (ex Lee et al. 2017)]
MKKSIIWTAIAATTACAAWAGASRIDRIAARVFAGNTTSAPATATARGPLQSEPVVAPAATAETTRSSRYGTPSVGAEVGDPGSFGRSVRFLGAMFGQGITFSSNCGGVIGNTICVPVDATTGEGTASLPDFATQTLPAGSMQNLLCHWATPFTVATFNNRTGVNRRRHYVRLQATITLENPGLVLPHRTDPSTRAPLAGSISFGLPSSELAERLDATESWSESLSFTRTCAGGFFSRSVLATQYGLSDAEIRAVYASPTQLRMKLDVATAGVSSGSATYLVRWVGD